jgi:peptidoglycan/xylan/chitin deacetylase (PgdA/CDA1 family)
MENTKLLILGLHRVGFPPQNAKIRGLFISPKLLEFQLSMIKKMGYRFVTLNQAMKDSSGKNAVITFDDGYADNINHAFPIMQKFEAPATAFVITNDIGKKNVVWNEAGEKLPSDLMDWDSLRFLQNQGWEIGSHAHEHIHLANYDKKKQTETISKSLTLIKENLGYEPVSFAYPYGSYNKTTKEILRNLGIKFAVTTNPSKMANETDLLELSRCSFGGRKYHHYVKSLLKLQKAVGSKQILQTIPKQVTTLISNIRQPQLSSLTANKNVMSRQQR